jgi:adenylosuccinate lyase
MVQSNAMKVWEIPEHQRSNLFKNLLIKDEDVRNFLDEAQIEKLFNLEQHFLHVDTIFKRVFSK